MITAKIGIAEFVAKNSCSSLTIVDSAEEGRNVALSFSWTSERLPAKGPAQLPTKSHMTAAPTASHRARLPLLVVFLAGVDCLPSDLAMA